MLLESSRRMDMIYKICPKRRLDLCTTLLAVMMSHPI